MNKRAAIYPAILERIFLSKFREGLKRVDFERSDIVRCAEEISIRLPKNLGDLIYSFRYRASLPESIERHAPEGMTWIIRGTGSAKYSFVLVSNIPLSPSAHLAETKVPDSTPGVVAKYSLSDEQALLARVRYNRLVDVFMGIACYSLQNHLRTSVSAIGQVETDELYVGVDRKGIHYVIPVQAKGGKDRLSIVQIEQDLAVCEQKFPSLVCRPVGAQFMRDSVIALFEFETTDKGLKVCAEKHYRLVPPEAVTEEDLRAYRSRQHD
jgi:hypothetical protein